MISPNKEKIYIRLDCGLEDLLPKEKVKGKETVKEKKRRK